MPRGLPDQKESHTMNRNLLLALAAFVVAGLAAIYFTQNRGADTTGEQAQVSDSADGTSGAAQASDAGEAPGEFRFSWDDYPEFAGILRPANREAFLSIHETDVVLGDPEAPVTIIEFFSYACPHCKRFHEGSYQSVLANYVDTGLVNFVKRDYLLNVQNVGLELWAGAGAQCFIDESQNKRFADLMFQQQSNLRRVNSPEGLVPVFVAAGLEERQALSCMTDPRNMNLVFGRAARAQRVADVRGTPTLFINGVRFTGNATDAAGVSAAIEAAIARAN